MRKTELQTPKNANTKKEGSLVLLRKGENRQEPFVHSVARIGRWRRGGGGGFFKMFYHVGGHDLDCRFFFFFFLLCISSGFEKNLASRAYGGITYAANLPENLQSCLPSSDTRNSTITELRGLFWRIGHHPSPFPFPVPPKTRQSRIQSKETPSCQPDSRRRDGYNPYTTLLLKNKGKKGLARPEAFFLIFFQHFGSGEGGGS